MVSRSDGRVDLIRTNCGQVSFAGVMSECDDRVCLRLSSWISQCTSYLQAARLPHICAHGALLNGANSSETCGLDFTVSPCIVDGQASLHVCMRSILEKWYGRDKK